MDQPLDAAAAALGAQALDEAPCRCRDLGLRGLREAGEVEQRRQALLLRRASPTICC